MRTVARTTKNNATNSTKRIKNPDCASCVFTSAKNENGSVAIIPIIINNDIPLPIPLSVIFSPNHMANIVPVDRMIILDSQNALSLTLGEIAPILFMYARYPPP